MNANQLKNILDNHKLWLDGAGGSRADLRGADLRGANLRGANLYEADLRGADLYGADLCGANLYEADLYGANLRGAGLRGAGLCEADLCEANLPDFQICPESGDFIAWKALGNKCIAKILVPKNAKRTSSLVGRKCRASHVQVLSIITPRGGHIKKCPGWRAQSFIYEVGKIVKADSFDDDIRVECAHGIHFFITRKEAEEWLE